MPKEKQKLLCKTHLGSLRRPGWLPAGFGLGLLGLQGLWSRRLHLLSPIRFLLPLLRLLHHSFFYPLARYLARWFCASRCDQIFGRQLFRFFVEAHHSSNSGCKQVMTCRGSKLGQPGGFRIFRRKVKKIIHWTACEGARGSRSTQTPAHRVRPRFVTCANEPSYFCQRHTASHTPRGSTPHRARARRQG